jgi:hypothetical protein
MRKSLTLFLKWVLMIPFFCLGVFFAVMGILAIMAAASEPPDDRSEFIFLAAIGVLWLIAGVGICFLAPMFPQLPAHSRRLSKEERTIENLRQFVKDRKFIIAGCVVFLAFVLWYLIVAVWKIKDLDALTTPDRITSTASFDANYELPILFSRFYTLAKSRAEWILCEWLMGICAVFLITVLVIEIRGYRNNRHRLTISMWESIQQLEVQVRELKTVKQPDAEHVTDPDSGEDTASG